MPSHQRRVSHHVRNMCSRKFSHHPCNITLAHGIMASEHACFMRQAISPIVEEFHIVEELHI